MLDLESLRIIRREQPEEKRFSFVGVRLSPADASPEFWLPQGFQAFPSGDYTRTVRLFFDLFRVMRTYVSQRGLKDDERIDKRDPLQTDKFGLHFSPEADTPLLTFAKLNVLEAILVNFDELVISSIISKQAPRNPESHEEVYKHLHEATYLEDDRIHFETLPSERIEVISGATQLVRLFSYIYAELFSQIYGPESLSYEMAANAAAFKEDFLSPSAGLFVEGSFKSTLDVLKEVLERVDRTTPYKDDDFWQLFNAVELFLYSDITDEADADGVVWGMSDFHPIWEEMCHAYARESFEEAGDRRILFAHTPQRANSSIGNQRVFTVLEEPHPFQLALNGRWRNMLPDMVAETIPPPRGKRFAEMIAVTKIPEAAAIPSRIIVRASQHIDAATSWLDEIKRLASKAGWHPVVSGRHQVTFNNIPARKFDQVYEKASANYARIATPRQQYAYVIDFKYHHPLEYCGERLSPKVQSDILKQHIYELALQYYLEEHDRRTVLITNQFVVPLYRTDRHTPQVIAAANMPSEMGDAKLCADYSDAGIELVAVSFDAAAQAYIRANT